jgi:hypothetical protein
MYIVDSVFLFFAFETVYIKGRNKSHRRGQYKKHEGGLPTKWNVEGPAFNVQRSTVGNFIRVANKFIIKVTWEVSD